MSLNNIRKASEMLNSDGSPATGSYSYLALATRPVSASVGFSWQVLCTGVSMINPIEAEILFAAGRGKNLVGFENLRGLDDRAYKKIAAKSGATKAIKTILPFQRLKLRKVVLRSRLAIKALTS